MVTIRLVHNATLADINKHLELQVMPREGELIVVKIDKLGITYKIKHIIHFAGKSGWTEIRVTEY